MTGRSDKFNKRAKRVRRALRARAGSGAATRPRLCVFRSSMHIYAQIIDDTKGHTITAASTLEKELRARLKTGADKAAAAEVGKLLAERAKAAGVVSVYFDRGGYGFHGRVKALADGAREGGLSF